MIGAGEGPGTIPGATTRTVAPESVGYPIVDVQAGSFRMGCDNREECDSDEAPVHMEQVSAFRLGKYELSQEVIERLKKADPNNIKLQSITTTCDLDALTGPRAFILGLFGKFRDGAKTCKLPAVRMDYEQNVAACGAMGGRPPTEVEWEYAASAGGQISPEKWATPGGELRDKEGKLQVCMYENCASGPMPVDSLGENIWKLHHMSGNVWEWTSTCYGPYLADGEKKDGTASAEGCAGRVMRGGAWGYSNARFLRVAIRFYTLPDISGYGLGGRCALPQGSKKVR